MHLRGRLCLQLQATGRLDEALASYDVTLQLKPNEAETWNNRAVALFATRQHFEESIASYRCGFTGHYRLK